MKTSDPINTQKSLSWLLIAPLLLYFVVFVLIPQIILLVMSFKADDGGISFDQMAKALTDTLTYTVLWSTLKLGFFTTIFTIIIGIPYAYCMVISGKKTKAFLLLMIVLPLLVSAVVRTFGWLVTLGNDGPLNQLLMVLGITDEPVRLLFTNSAVIIGLTQIELPIMVLSIYTILSKIDLGLLQASRSLGAGMWMTFFKIVIPLSIPGVIAGSTLVFSSAIGSFVAQTILGGGSLLFMPMYIYQQSILTQNWGFAACLSIILMVTVISIILAGTLLARRSKGYIYG